MQDFPNMGNMGTPTTGEPIGNMETGAGQPDVSMMSSSPIMGSMPSSGGDSASPVVGGENFSPEEMDAFISELKKKYQKYINTKELTAAKVNQYKEKILRDLYDFLIKNGIDPMDRNQISAFLADLEQESPDVYDLVQMAIDSVLKFVDSPVDTGPELPSPFSEPTAQVKENSLDKFKNLGLK